MTSDSEPYAIAFRLMGVAAFGLRRRALTPFHPVAEIASHLPVPQQLQYWTAAQAVAGLSRRAAQCPCGLSQLIVRGDRSRRGHESLGLTAVQDSWPNPLP
jgi:hypothetical protein